MLVIAWHPPPPKSVSMISLTGSAAAAKTAETAMTAHATRSLCDEAILILHSSVKTDAADRSSFIQHCDR